MKILKSIGLLSLTMICFMSSAYASSNYPGGFSSKYSTYTALSSCAICHTTTPAVNSFGAQLKAQGAGGGNLTTLAAALTAVEGLDADNDGATNLAEITANTNFIDPNSTPVAADTTAPVITLLGSNPMTVTQNTTFTDPGSSVTDNVDTGLTATVTGTVDAATVGTYTLTYTATDAAGNIGTTTRTVNVVAAVAAVFGITSTSFTNNGVIPTALACTGQGGNNASPQIALQNIPTGTQSINIIMEDTSTNPVTVHWGVFQLLPTDIASGIAENAAVSQTQIENLGSNFATAGFNYTGGVGYEGPCPSAQHTYVIKVYALDATTANVAKFFGATSIKDANQFTSVPYVVIEPSPTTASFEAALPPLSINILASATLTGTFGTASADTEAPVITLVGSNPMIVTQNTVFTDPGSSVTDNVDTGLTATATGTVNTAIVGTYTINYNVSDAAGNAAITVTRTVNVVAAPGTNPTDPGTNPTDPGTTSSSSGGFLSMSPWMLLALLPLLAIRRRK